MKVLVTGGCGALGHEVCRLLRSRGHTVVSVDRQARRNAPNLSYQVADLKNYDRIRALFQGVECVVHTAALHGLHLAEGCDEQELFKTNVQSLFHVLSACVEHGVRRLIFTSSTSVYGVSALRDLDRAVWLDERSPTRWTDLYDQTKLIGEHLCREFARTAGLEVIVLRPTRFFVGDPIHHNLRKLWRAVDLVDVAQAHFCALSAESSQPYRVYNVAARSPFSPDDRRALYQDAPRMIETNFPGLLRFAESRGWQLPQRIDRVFDIRKAESELGYEPQHNFEQFLEGVGFYPKLRHSSNRRMK